MAFRRRAVLLVVVLAIAMFAVVGAANAEPVTVTLIGPDEELVTATPYYTTHWDQIWDLTKGDLWLSYTIDMNNLKQPGKWDTYNGTTLYSEVGLVGEGAGTYFNPGTAWDTYQGSCGGWMVHDDDTWNDGDGYTEKGDPTPDKIQDLDDKIALQASGGRGERDYDVLLSDPDVVGPTQQDPWYPNDPSKVVGAYGLYNWMGNWWDRDGVDPWQSTTYANTDGIYHIVIRYHAIDDGLGVMFATINGIQQGFNYSGWDYPPDEYFGLSFKGDMKHMQVFTGVWGPNSEAWALQQYGDTYKQPDGSYYFDYGSVTLSNMTVTGEPGTSDPLVADYTATPGAGNEVTFDASAQGGMGPYTYKWNFGDGTPVVTADGPTTSHTFAGPGDYTVTLAVFPFRCYPKYVAKTITVEPPKGDLTVLKFNDANGNGLFDADEVPIPGWHIQVFDGETLVAEGDTGADGRVTFTLPIGTYTVKEDTSDATWTATTGDTIEVTVTAEGGTYDSMYATGFVGGVARAVEVTLDPYNPPNHAQRLNPANALGPFDADQSAQQAGVLNERFFAVASQSSTDFTFAENFFNVDGVTDIDFAEVTWGAWHTEAAKVYLTGAVVDGVPYTADDGGLGVPNYYAGIVWNKVGIVGIDAATRNTVAQSYLPDGVSRTFEDNEFSTEGNYGVSGFNLPAEVDYASDITLVDITKDVYNKNTIPTSLFAPATYTNVGGTGQRVILTGVDPFDYAELGPADGNTDGYDLDAIRVHRPVAFGNQSLEGYVEAFKYYDANANGMYDDGEAAIEGWKIEVLDAQGMVVDTKYTDADGRVTFTLLPGDYTVREVMPIECCWMPTTSLTQCVTVGNRETEYPEFGNLCLGAGGGLTLGFWSNKNGQKLVGADDLVLLSALNLRNANSTDFYPADYKKFRTWLLSATANNMAYMLSAQLAAMELNVLNGKVAGDALIYAPGTNSANVLGFATVAAVMDEANVELGFHGQVLADSNYRAYQEALKNALDRANNNYTFVQAGPCIFTY